MTSDLHLVLVAKFLPLSMTHSFEHLSSNSLSIIKKKSTVNLVLSAVTCLKTIHFIDSENIMIKISCPKRQADLKHNNPCQ